MKVLSLVLLATIAAAIPVAPEQRDVDTYDNTAWWGKKEKRDVDTYDNTAWWGKRDGDVDQLDNTAWWGKKEKREAQA